MTQRYALYYAPRPEAALNAIASQWLGRNPETGQTRAVRPVPGLHPERHAEIVAEPSLYGFHGTLKPPFHLAPETDEGQLIMALERFAAVRQAYQGSLGLRLSATDWVEDGWNPDETVELARRLKDLGVDLIDVSSGGTAANAEIPTGPGYQTRFAERVRKESGIATGTVGMITEPAQAEHILRTCQADIIFLARELLRDPYWPLHADDDLGGRKATWPAQYQRATHRDQPIHESDLRE